MREIKFRGQDIDGNWVYGSLLKYSDSISYIASNIIEKPMELVSTETVGQYTGLLDKNGKEIYDGDIVNDIGIIKIISSSKRYPGAFWCTDDSNIENYGCGDYSELLGYSNKDFLKIIGNIYENPELLTK